MRDIYETAKKAQMAPVRGRVKAMMAQPRAVAQARKTARQTTGFARGGLPEKKKHKLGPHIYTGTGPTFPRPPKEDIEGKKILKKQSGGTVQPMSHNSELTKWFKEQWGGTKKGKPHSTREGRIAAGERALRRNEKYWTKRREEEKKRKEDPHHPRDKRRAGPGAPAQPSPKAGPPAGRQGLPKPKKEDPGMYVKKGGVMEKGKPHSTKEGRQTQKAYKLARILANKDRMTTRDIERAKKLSKIKWDASTEAEYQKFLNVGTERQKAIDEIIGRIKTVPITEKQKGGVMNYKKGGKVDKKWIQKAVNPKHKGYCTPMTKKTCTPARKRLAKLFKSKAKKGWANGGTVVMPTVGNDVRTRAYKHGALIHPRPKPTTVAHGRGVGIAKRGW